MLFRPKLKDAKPQERAIWGSLMSLGLHFPIAILLGFFIGRWIGGKFGHPTEGQYIGLVWGVAAAFYELFKVSSRMIKLDEEQQKKEQEKSKDGHSSSDEGKE